MKGYLDKLKTWYLRMWDDYNPQTFAVHIFIGVIIIIELWSSLT